MADGSKNNPHLDKAVKEALSLTSKAQIEKSLLTYTFSPESIAKHLEEAARIGNHELIIQLSEKIAEQPNEMSDIGIQASLDFYARNIPVILAENGHFESFERVMAAQIGKGRHFITTIDSALFHQMVDNHMYPPVMKAIINHPSFKPTLGDIDYFNTKLKKILSSPQTGLRELAAWQELVEDLLLYHPQFSKSKTLHDIHSENFVTIQKRMKDATQKFKKTLERHQKKAAEAPQKTEMLKPLKKDMLEELQALIKSIDPQMAKYTPGYLKSVFDKIKLLQEMIEKEFKAEWTEESIKSKIIYDILSIHIKELKAAVKAILEEKSNELPKEEERKPEKKALAEERHEEPKKEEITKVETKVKETPKDDGNEKKAPEVTIEAEPPRTTIKLEKDLDTSLLAKLESKAAEKLQSKDASKDKR